MTPVSTFPSGTIPGVDKYTTRPEVWMWCVYLVSLWLHLLARRALGNTLNKHQNFNGNRLDYKVIFVYMETLERSF